MDMNPTGHSALPHSISSGIPTNMLYSPTSLLNNQIKSMGIDDRYPVGLYNLDEIMRIIHIINSFEKLQLIQNKVFIEEDVKKDKLINEILKTDEIQTINIKSGGLFDDWERNI